MKDLRVLTSQTPRVRMTDYKFFWYARAATDTHSKINMRGNILSNGTPIGNRLL